MHTMPGLAHTEEIRMPREGGLGVWGVGLDHTRGDFGMQGGKHTHGAWGGPELPSSPLTNYLHRSLAHEKYHSSLIPKENF